MGMEILQIVRNSRKVRINFSNLQKDAYTNKTSEAEKHWHIATTCGIRSLLLNS